MDTIWKSLLTCGYLTISFDALYGEPYTMHVLPMGHLLWLLSSCSCQLHSAPILRHATCLPATHTLSDYMCSSTCVNIKDQLHTRLLQVTCHGVCIINQGLVLPQLVLGLVSALLKLMPAERFWTSSCCCLRAGFTDLTHMHAG